MPSKHIPVLLRTSVTGMIGAVHIASFGLPVFQVGGGRVIMGYEVALFGGFGIFSGVMGWFANPFFWLGVLFLACGSIRTGSSLAVVGLLLALTTLLLKNLVVDESGSWRPITGHGPGFYVWLASYIALAATGLSFRLLSQQVAPSEQTDVASQRPSEGD